MVGSRAPLLVLLDQASRLEHLDVSGGRRPSVREHAGNLTRRHRSALEMQRDQDPPAHRMRERGEHSLVGVHPRLRHPRRTLPCHRQIFSLFTKHRQEIFMMWAKLTNNRNEERPSVSPALIAPGGVEGWRKVISNTSSRTRLE